MTSLEFFNITKSNNNISTDSIYFLYINKQFWYRPLDLFLGYFEEKNQRVLSHQISCYFAWISKEQLEC